MARVEREISAILRAAGHIEEARALLEHVMDHQNYRDRLKVVADDLAATAVADRVRIANDIEQNYGRH